MEGEASRRVKRQFHEFRRELSTISTASNKFLNSMGLNPKIDPADSKKLKNDLLDGGTERAIKEPQLNKKLMQLYFTDIINIPKVMEEYSYVSQKIKEIDDLRLYKFIAQSLYLKSYGENLSVLTDVYTNETGKTRKNFQKIDDYYSDYNNVMSKHKILDNAMDRELRNSIAHNLYGKLEEYT